MEILIMAPHVLAGLLALALYWRTLLAAKGSRPHRRWGRVYLVMLRKRCFQAAASSAAGR